MKTKRIWFDYVVSAYSPDGEFLETISIPGSGNDWPDASNPEFALFVEKFGGIGYELRISTKQREAEEVERQQPELELFRQPSGEFVDKYICEFCELTSPHWHEHCVMCDSPMRQITPEDMTRLILQAREFEEKIDNAGGIHNYIKDELDALRTKLGKVKF